jgi:hypothetical protein
LIKHLLLLAALPGALLDMGGKPAAATTAWELPPSPVAPKPRAPIDPSRASRPDLPGFSVTTTEWRSPNISLAGIITFELELHLTRDSGPSGWAETDGDGRIRTMLKNLLNGRFDLSLDAEKRELSVCFGFACLMVRGLPRETTLKIDWRKNA